MDEVVSIEFLESAENTSDIMTKNQQSACFKSAQPKLEQHSRTHASHDQSISKLCERHGACSPTHP